MDLLLTDAEVDGRRSDVRVADGRITEIGHRLAPRSTLPEVVVLDAAGGALLPGLHDHHLHLYAMAAAAGSVRVGPPTVTDERSLRAALRAAARGSTGWLRTTGYHESVAGVLDRDRLDGYVADRPLRVQHRSGALWMLNSAAVAAAQLEDVQDIDVDRDLTGRVTGRLWRWDRQLGARLPRVRPDLAGVGRALAAYGITGVTDATPDLTDRDLRGLAAAVADGTLPQELTLLGVPLDTAAPDGLRVGPYKLLLHDHDLPTFDELTARLRAAHGAGRPVAVHCVTRESLLLTLAALDVVGGRPGDRIEHAAVVPPQVRAELAARGVRVVTQPGFLTERGDSYLTETDPGDRPLYPYRSLCDAGVPVTASSDAPFGPADPWAVIHAAATRLAPSGAVVGAAERVSAELALAGYLSPAADPGGPARSIRIGAVADLVVLDRSLAQALRAPDQTRVRLTLRAGRPVAAA